MKLFKIILDQVDYDMYDSCIIAAESYEQVEKMCQERKFPEGDFTSEQPCFNIDEIYDLDRPMEEWPTGRYQNYRIEEIKLEDIKEPVILCSSYNAG